MQFIRNFHGPWYRSQVRLTDGSRVEPQLCGQLGEPFSVAPLIGDGEVRDPPENTLVVEERPGDLLRQR